MELTREERKNEFKAKMKKAAQAIAAEQHNAIFDAEETIRNYRGNVSVNDVTAFDNETRVLVSLGLTSYETAELDRKDFLAQAQELEKNELIKAKRLVFGAGYTAPKRTEQTTYNTVSLDSFLFEQGFLSQ